MASLNDVLITSISGFSIGLEMPGCADVMFFPMKSVRYGMTMNNESRMVTPTALISAMKRCLSILAKTSFIKKMTNIISDVIMTLRTWLYIRRDIPTASHGHLEQSLKRISWKAQKARGRNVTAMNSPRTALDR